MRSPDQDRRIRFGTPAAGHEPVISLYQTSTSLTDLDRITAQSDPKTLLAKINVWFLWGTQAFIPHTHRAGVFLKILLALTQLTDPEFVSEHSCADGGFKKDLFMQLFIATAGTSAVSSIGLYLYKQKHPFQDFNALHSAEVIFYRLLHIVGEALLIHGDVVKTYPLSNIKAAYLLLLSPLYSLYVLARHAYQRLYAGLPQTRVIRHGPCPNEPLLQQAGEAIHLSVSFTLGTSAMLSYMRTTLLGELMGDDYEAHLNTLLYIQGALLLLCLMSGLAVNSDQRSILDKTTSKMHSAYFTCLPLLTLLACVIPNLATADYTTAGGWLFSLFAFIMFAWVSHSRGLMGSFDMFSTVDNTNDNLSGQTAYQESPSLLGTATTRLYHLFFTTNRPSPSPSAGSDISNTNKLATVSSPRSSSTARLSLAEPLLPEGPGFY